MPKRSHGAHNKKVCDRLYLQNDYVCNDWVVTACFYSAIHYIDHALFPCDYNGKTYNNINEAHKSIGGNTKHKIRSILLNKNLPKHKGEYEFLITESQNARYSNYNVHVRIADKAVRNLEAIMSSYDKEKNKIAKEVA